MSEMKFLHIKFIAREANPKRDSDKLVLKYQKMNKVNRKKRENVKM